MLARGEDRGHVVDLHRHRMRAAAIPLGIALVVEADP